jgi:methylmalonyl-CoA/ethylmalonyl-CoA epimerase
MYRLDHVAVVVDDLEEAKRFVEDVLGLSLKSEWDSPATSAKAVFYGFGEVDIELLEVHDPAVQTIRMGGERKARIEHLGIRVPDLDAAVAELTARGVRMSTAKPYGAGAWSYYFTDPETTDGVMYQLFQTED